MLLPVNTMPPCSGVACAEAPDAKMRARAQRGTRGFSRVTSRPRLRDLVIDSTEDLRIELPSQIGGIYLHRERIPGRPGVHGVGAARDQRSHLRPVRLNIGPRLRLAAPGNRRIEIERQHAIERFIPLED